METFIFAIGLTIVAIQLTAQISPNTATLAIYPLDAGRCRLLLTVLPVTIGVVVIW
jgi:hypothetical protein